MDIYFVIKKVLVFEGRVPAGRCLGFSRLPLGALPGFVPGWRRWEFLIFLCPL